MAQLERLYAAGEISNSSVADGQAESFRGIQLPDLVAKLLMIPCIEGIDAVLLSLRERGIG